MANKKLEAKYKMTVEFTETELRTLASGRVKTLTDFIFPCGVVAGLAFMIGLSGYVGEEAEQVLKAMALLPGAGVMMGSLGLSLMFRQRLVNKKLAHLKAGVKPIFETGIPSRS